MMSQLSCLRTVVPSCLIVVLLAAALTGCTRTDGPAYLSIESEQYHDAFDAAVDVARRYEFIASLRDRRGGVIETEPAHAGTLLEPWKRATMTVDRALESTLSFQRRRARFEFRPIAFDPGRQAQPRDSAEQPDLTTYIGEIELRVWVYVERSHEPGVRRSTWSRRLSDRASVIDPESGERITHIWTPTARDPLLERHLLAKISDALRDS